MSKYTRFTMSSETVEWVEVRDARLRTARTGDGPPLVWCHGGPGVWDYLGSVAAMTDDLVTSYRYDQRGCGRSTGAGPHTVERSVQDLEALRLHWGLEHFFVAGHSWGAQLALHYALAYPQQVAGLVYVSGTGIDGSWREEYRAERVRRLGVNGERERRALEAKLLAEGTLEAEHRFCEIQWSTDFADAATGRERARKLLVPGLRVNRHVNAELGADAARAALDPSLPQRLRSLAVPALVIHGSADPRPSRAAVRVTEILPHAEMTLLDGAAHYPWVEAPAQFERVLRAYLQARVPHSGV
jgi:proline iminopeptidase